jgi:transcriptional regulator with XRE-family HTH domain
MITIGEALRIERQKSNISLDEISQKTNIGKQSLLTLENNQMTKIPGDFYLKNYIKSYLKSVGGDEKVFWEIFDKKIETDLPEAPQKAEAYYSKLRYSRFKKKNFVLSLTLGAALIVLIGTIFFIGKGDNHHEKVITPKPVMIAEIKPVHSTDFKMKTFSLDEWPAQVDLEFLGNCWIQVYRGDRKIIEQVFKIGEKITVKGYELNFFIGNPSSVKFILDNREVTYLKGLTRTARITVTPDKIEEILKR